MKYKKNNKGFTIIELVITLGVFAIVGTLITGLVIMASNFTSEQNKISFTLREIDDSKEMIINWFSKYDRDLYSFVEVDGSKVNISEKDVAPVNSIEFIDGNLISSETTIILKYIDDIKFINLPTGNLIKCTFVLYDDQEFSFLINRRTV